MKSGTCRCLASPQCLSGIRERSRTFFAGAGFPADQVELLVLGVGEACANVIRHACANDPRRVFRVGWRATPSLVRVRIRDYATPLDPRALPTRDLGQIKPGGLGLPLIQAAFDRVQFIPRRRGTELLLEKARPKI